MYNLPEHGNKEDIVFFLWKALEKCKALLRHTNPVHFHQIDKSIIGGELTRLYKAFLPFSIGDPQLSGPKWYFLRKNLIS